MTPCTLLSDRMPAVARGVGRWSAEDAAHLESCADCRAEWRLLAAAVTMGDGLIGTLDPSRAASQVLTALRAPAPHRNRRPLRWAIPLAVAAGLALALVPALRRGSGPALPVPALLPEVETLSETELESVISLLPGPGAADPGGIETVTDEELDQILDDLEG